MKNVVDAAHGLRERKKVRTHEAIIDAALELFERQGYDATTIEDIAAADVSPRTFFRYFESKLDLIMARSGSKVASLSSHIDARPACEGVLDAVRQVIREELEEQLADPLVVRELQVMLTTRSLQNVARAHYHEEEAELVGVVAHRLGLDPDDLTVHVTASAITSAVWTTINRWAAEGADPGRLQPVLDRAFALLATGFDASRPPGGRRRRRQPT